MSKDCLVSFPSACLVIIASLASSRVGTADELYNFACNSREVHNGSVWSVRYLENSIHISGTLKMIGDVNAPVTVAVAEILLRGPDATNGALTEGVGIKFVYYQQPEKTLHVRLKGPDSPEHLTDGVVTAEWEAAIPFELMLDSSGLLRATVLGKSESLLLHQFSPATLEMSCFQGGFRFTDVSVSRNHD